MRYKFLEDVVKITDGLGNQMFQYAFALRLHMVNGRRVYLDTRFINHEDKFVKERMDWFYQNCDRRKYGLENFRITLPKANADILARWQFVNQRNSIEKFLYSLSQNDLWFWRLKEEGQMGVENTLSLLKKHIRPVYFMGYYFDLRYFDEIRPFLQKEFCLKKPILLPAHLRKILNGSNTVGIHIRRGDFTKVFRDISQKNYYPKAMEIMDEHVEAPIYLVFSDDIGWVKENLNINGRKLYISEMGFSDYEEFAIMKHCKHHIIANSTFSYWAAYLNRNPNKTVICPKRWKTGIIPKDWISI
jgi:hypothetical protein